MNAVEQSFWGNFKAIAEIKVPFLGQAGLLAQRLRW